MAEESQPIRVQVKSVKVTVPVEAAAFPLDRVPPPGTPGAKNMEFAYRVEHAGGALSVTFKGAQLQKLAAAVAAAPQGGFVVLQGKLGPDNTLVEAGAVFQPAKAEQAAPAEAARAG